MRQFLRFACMALVFFLAFGRSAEAQVVGQVFDYEGFPLENVSVLVYNQPVGESRQLVAMGFTNANGDFSVTRESWPSKGVSAKEEVSRPVPSLPFEDGCRYQIEIMSEGYQLQRMELVCVNYGSAHLGEVNLYPFFDEASVLVAVKGRTIYWELRINRQRPRGYGLKIETHLTGTGANTLNWSGTVSQPTDYRATSQRGYLNKITIPQGVIPSGTTFCGEVTVSYAWGEWALPTEQKKFCVVLDTQYKWTW